MDPGLCLIKEKALDIVSGKLRVLPVITTLNKAVLIKIIATFMPIVHKLNMK